MAKILGEEQKNTLIFFKTIWHFLKLPTIFQENMRLQEKVSLDGVKFLEQDGFSRINLRGEWILRK